MRALAERGYQTPTPIQSAAIPHAMIGRDLIGIAQTGTGKTAAFALPIIHRLAAAPARPERKSCRVLVLSPTRELSGQIAESFETYGRHLRLSVALAIGGVPIGRQIRRLAGGVDVLVATPGRLTDLQRSRAIQLDRVEVLVLDEADRMLDMGFVRDIRKIVALLPSERQTLFFSATMPGEIARLAGEMLNDPVRVAVTPAATTAERVDQRAVHIERSGKAGHLATLLKQEPIDRALVFTRTKHGADKVVRGLVKAGINADAIHGNKSQGQRERALAAFRSGRVRTLVATDIAARGIDVAGISHVINFDLPNVAESYVHRIGRTARAGREGVAISFCSPDEVAYLRDIEKLIRQDIPATRADGQAVAATREDGHGDAPRSTRKPRRRKGGERRQASGGSDGRPESKSQAGSHSQAKGISGLPLMQPARRGSRRHRAAQAG